MDIMLHMERGKEERWGVIFSAVKEVGFSKEANKASRGEEA